VEVGVLQRREACVLVLDPAAEGAMAASGASRIRAPNCGIQVNSTSDMGLTVDGSARVSARQICLEGGWEGRGISPQPKSDCHLESDPYAHLAEPAAPACQMLDLVTKASYILPSGLTYCGRISIEGNTSITLEPGIVYFKGVEVNMAGNSRIEGEGVTLFLDRNSSLNMTGTSEIRLVAPAIGPYEGIAIFQSRHGPSRTSKIYGNAQLRVSGSIYAPQLDLSMTGHGQLNSDF
jgi:hypothetical protein